MDQLQRTRLDVKLKKLFPKDQGVQFSYQHVYGHTTARMRFIAEFDVTTIRAVKVKSSLTALRNLIDNMIENIPEDEDESDSNVS
jgi:hypothetical protein